MDAEGGDPYPAHVMRRGIPLLICTAVLLVGFAFPVTAEALPAPTIQSFTAAEVTTTTANLKATVLFEGLNDASWQFTWCKQVACPNGTVEGERAGPAPSEFGVPQTIEEALTGLSPGTAYSVTLVTENDDWNEVGSELGRPPTRQTLTFTTAEPVIPPVPVAPQATTGTATGVTQDVATLNGSLVPGTTGGSGLGTTAFFEWGQGESLEHRTPVQTFAADATQGPVSANISGLSPNREYAFRLVAERGGQGYQGAVGHFTTPTARPCPAGSAYQRVEAGRVIVSGCFYGDGAKQWVAAGEVSLNGLALEPQGSAPSGSPYAFASCTSKACTELQGRLEGGNRFYLDQPGEAFGTTGVWKMSAGERLRNISVTKLTATDVEWNGGAPVLTLGANASVELFGGFPLAGEFTWTPEADGSSKLGMYVAIPIAAEGITGQTTVRVNPGGDVQLDDLKVTAGKIAIKQFELGGLSFLYNREEEEWEGAANVVLPIPSRRIKVGATVAVKNGRFSKLEGEAAEINEDLGYGVFLQKVGVAFGLEPLVIGGNFELSAGPEVLGTSLLGLEGGFEFQGSHTGTRYEHGVTLGIQYPPSFTVSGKLTVAEYPLRENTATWYITNEPWFEVSGKMSIGPPEIAGYRLWGLEATVGGGLHGTEFSAEAEGELEVLTWHVARAAGLLNNKGIAACGSVSTPSLGSLHGASFSIGGWLGWSGGSGSFYSCDMEELGSQLAGASSIALASAAGEGIVPLHPGDSKAMIRIVGDGAVPRVRLVGPGGRTIETPPTTTPAPGRYPGALVLQDPTTDSLYVLLAHPGNGHWSYETLSGSPPVKLVQTAGPLPAPRVSAKVTDLPHGKRRLDWHLRPLGGQRVVFMEDGPGAPPRVLARTDRAVGGVSFRPTDIPQRKRRIVAVVEEHGKPRARLTVARYTAPPPPRLGRITELRADRRGGKLKLRWKPEPAAVGYRVVVTDALGGSRLHTVKHPSLTLTGAEAAGLRSASVRAVDLDGRTSGPRTVGLEAKPRLSGLRVTSRDIEMRLSATANVELSMRSCRTGRCRLVAHLTAPRQPSGTMRLALPRRLVPGSYQVVVQAQGRDGSGPVMRRTVVVR
jgi:hypothetical protein